MQGMWGLYIAAVLSKSTAECALMMHGV